MPTIVLSTDTVIQFPGLRMQLYGGWGFVSGNRHSDTEAPSLYMPSSHWDLDQ